MQKAARKSTQYSRNETIRPSYKDYSSCKGYSLGQKFKMPKICNKTILQELYKSFSLQKTAEKNTQYSRNETIFKKQPSCKGYIAHAKAI